MSIPWICRQCLSRLAQQTPRSGAKPWRRLASSTTTPAGGADNTSISPFLLSKARASAAEHASLTSKLSDTYDNAAAKRIGELETVTAALKKYEDANSSLTELHSLLHDPSSDAELRTLASEDLEATSTQLASATRTLTETLIPRHPFAHLPCLLEIRAGVGGSEASLFAADLLRMYMGYCSRNFLRTNLIKYEAGDGKSTPDSAGAETPMSEAILEINSPGAYGRFRSEAGVHRVQRVPATEKQGRMHTSAAAVMVLPSFPEGEAEGSGEEDFENPNSDYYVPASEVKTEVMRARGAGGQHVNTTDSKVRLTHEPTGMVVEMSTSRSQIVNRQRAWQTLRAKLALAKREAREEEMLALRRRVGGTGKSNRTDKVRTYNWSQARVTDHRSGFGGPGILDGVMGGGEDLESVMESVRKWLVERDVEDLAAEEEDAKEKEREKEKKK